MQRAEFFNGGGLRRVGASGEKRIALRVAEDVHVTVARACGHIEIHFGRRLRGFREERIGVSQQAGRSRHRASDENFTSCEHAAT